jgi:hypothetical protein
VLTDMPIASAIVSPTHLSDHQLTCRHRSACHRSRMIKLLRLLLDNNADILHYVRNLVLEIPYNEGGDDVVRVLEKLHPVRFFQLSGSRTNWNTLRSSTQKALLRLIHSPSLTHLRISFFWNFPATAFIPCIALTDLAICSLGLNTDFTGYDNDEEYTISEHITQIQLFTFGDADDHIASEVLHAKRSTGLPLLDFSNLKTLNVTVYHKSCFDGRKTLLQASEKLETLHYRGMNCRNTFLLRLNGNDSPFVILVEYLEDGCKDSATWLNKSSLSTLKRLHFVLGIAPDFEDPLCGLCEELTQLAGLNVIEEITLHVFSLTDESTDHTRWGRLDAVFVNGFPMLRQVSFHIDFRFFSYQYDDLAFHEKLRKIPEYFPWLSRSTIIAFKFSAEIVNSDDNWVVKY